jgi:transposase
MSGYSSSITCPNCGGDAEIYTDWKPFDYSSITCYHCGLQIYPKISYMTLKELNEQRRNWDLPILRKKPKQEKDIW